MADPRSYRATDYGGIIDQADVKAIRRSFRHLFLRQQPPHRFGFLCVRKGQRGEHGQGGSKVTVFVAGRADDAGFRVASAIRSAIRSAIALGVVRKCCRSSTCDGRLAPCQCECRGFEPYHPLLRRFMVTSGL